MARTIAEWREKVDFSQQELAEAVEVSVSVVSKWERNVHVPRPMIQRLICQAISAKLKTEITVDDVTWPAIQGAVA
jgi:DNA-binding transcriptional regulator YiaG